MDSPRFLIHEHCKKLLMNLLLVLSAHNDHFSVAKIILGNKDMNEDTALTLPVTAHSRDSLFMGKPLAWQYVITKQTFGLYWVLSLACAAGYEPHKVTSAVLPTRAASCFRAEL